MSERYKVIDSTTPTFITHTIIDWIDLFIKPQYTAILDTPQKLEQRLKYIHDNPMGLELVDDVKHWTNSSILAYTDEKHQSNIKLDVLFR